jgi:hypothetical protein
MARIDELMAAAQHAAAVRAEAAAAAIVEDNKRRKVFREYVTANYKPKHGNVYKLEHWSFTPPFVAAITSYNRAVASSKSSTPATTPITTSSSSSSPTTTSETKSTSEATTAKSDELSAAITTLRSLLTTVRPGVYSLDFVTRAFCDLLVSKPFSVYLLWPCDTLTTR